MSAAQQRLYYMGTEYMAESASLEADKYSMRFDQASNSKDPYEQSRKKPQQPPQSSFKAQEHSQPSAAEPKRLGPTVFNRIRVTERYKDQNKLDTDDPDILYGFFVSYRKQKASNPNFQKQTEKLKVAMERAEKIDPQLQRKILSRLEFERILDYEPQDVYYTLVIEKKKMDEDRKLQQHADKLNRQAEPKKQKKATKEMIDRLYDPEKYSKRRSSEKELSNSLRQSRSISAEARRRSLSQERKIEPEIVFGKSLLELYRDRTHTVGVITVEGLYNFWTSVQDKKEHGLVLSSSDVRPALQKYMVRMVQNLRKAHFQNKKFNTCEDSTLLKFLNTCQKSILDRFEVSIPLEGFKTYLEEYNKFVEVEKKKRDERAKKQQDKQKEDENKMKRTALTRPASATPLEILAQPKNNHAAEAIELIKLYPQDKTLKEFLKTRIHQTVRRPEEYGVYHAEQEIKRKQWVKSQKGMNPQRKIQQMVMNSTIKGFEANTPATTFTSAAVKKIFDEEYLQDDEKWQNMHLDLSRELKILAYKLPWCRTALLSFCEQQMSKSSYELQSKDDNTLVEEIISFLTKLPESSRKAKLAYLSHDISVQQAKSKFDNHNKQIEDDPEQQAKHKRKFYWFMESKAKEYVKTYLADGAQAGTQSRTAALNSIFEAARSQHPAYLQKHFPVVQSEAHHACPPLFKHQFFRIVKEINPYTVQKQSRPKSHIWAPTSTKSDSINMPTFNRIVKAYSKNKCILKEEPKSKQQKDPSPPKKGKKPMVATATIWTKQKTDQRLKFMMTYDQARECTFKPIVHKAVM